MKSFLIKTINLILAVGFLTGYDTLLQVHAQRNDIARLQAELESSRQTVEYVKADVKKIEHTSLPDSAAVSSASPAEQEDSGLKDGIYEGEAEGFGGIIRVRVCVTDGLISDVEIVSAEKEDPVYLEMASEITEEIVQAQSADIDTVSGATFSSTGIRDAAALAIEKAGN